MKTTTPHELQKDLKQGNVILIDVREPAEHKSEHIEGAPLIPLSKLSLSSLPSISKPIVLHCHSGKRSTAGCKKLLEENPSLNLASLEGGIVAWKEAGFDTNKSSKNTLPLDRQTQLTIGTLTLIGSACGYFFSPNYFIIPAVIGAGLMNAGLSGWCGMAKLLAKMPWNQR